MVQLELLDNVHLLVCGALAGILVLDGITSSTVLGLCDLLDSAGGMGDVVRVAANGAVLDLVALLVAGRWHAAERLMNENKN